MIKVGKEEVGIWKEELAELGMKMNGVREEQGRKGNDFGGGRKGG